jgi:hypothetical protein
MAITPFGFTLPNRTMSQMVFDAAMAQLMGKWPTWNTEVNATEANIVSLASAVALQSSAAVNAMNSVLSVANTTKWVTGTNYAQGVTTWSPLDFLSYRRKVAGVSGTDPSLDPTGWQLVVDNRPYWRQTTGGNISASQILNANSANVLEYTPTTSALSIQLQDATTLKIGPATQLIGNRSTRYDLSVRNAQGTLLCVVNPGGFVTLGLAKQADAAGEWTATGNGVKYTQHITEDYALGTVTHPAQGAKGYIKMSETLAVFIGRNGGTCYLQALDFATMTVGSAVAVPGFDSSASALGRTAGYMISAAAGAVIALSATGTTYYALGFTLTGVAISPGAVATKAAGGNVSVQVDCAFQRYVAQLGSSFAVPVSITSSKPGLLACQVTGASAVWGNIVDTGQTFPSTIMHCGIYPVSATQVALIAGSTSGYGASMATISGSAIASVDNNSGITATAFTTNTGHRMFAALQMNTDEWWFIFAAVSNALAGMRLKRASAASVLLQSNAMSGAPGGDFIVSPIDTSAPGGYCPDNHAFFNKFDPGAAWLYVPAYTVLYMLRITHDGTNFNIAASNSVPAFSGASSGVENNRPPYVAGPVPVGCHLALMRGYVSGQTSVSGRVALMDIDLRSGNVPQARASFPIDLHSDLTTATYNDHEVFYRNSKGYFIVTTGKAVNQYPELIVFDTTSGAVLSRSRLNRNVSGGAQGGNISSAERSIFTMINGAYAVSVEKNRLNVMELAK